MSTTFKMYARISQAGGTFEDFGSRVLSVATVLPSVQEPRAARAGLADNRTRLRALAFLLFSFSSQRLIATLSRFRHHCDHQVLRKPCPHFACSSGVQPRQLRCIPSLRALRSRQPSRTSHLPSSVRVYILTYSRLYRATGELERDAASLLAQVAQARVLPFA